MNYSIIIFSIATLLLAGCINPGQAQAPSTDAGQQGVPPNANTQKQAKDSGQGEVVKIDMAARQWDFNPSEITVKSGQKVMLKISVPKDDVAHGFFLPEYGINEQLTPGETTTIEFTAGNPGTYNFACSVYCGEGHSVMGGKLIVEK